MNLAVIDDDSNKFEKYVETVLDNEWMGWEVQRTYGITCFGRRFAFVVSYEVWYAVRLVMEPEHDDQGNYIEHERPVPCKEFMLRSSANAYVKQEHYELQAKSKMGNHNDIQKFSQLIENKVAKGLGAEVYRLYDVDTEGKLFVFILSKLITYTALLIREPYLIYDGSGRYLEESLIVLSQQFLTRNGAENFIQSRHNELKGFHVSVEKPKNVTILSDCASYDDVPDNGTQDSFNEPLSRSARWSTFKSFVEESIAKAFRGEEIYRKYGITEAGQYFAFVVTKLDRYLVRVVLEPDDRYYRVMDDTVEEYSCTFDLPKIQKRLGVDNWVAKNSKILVDKSENLLKAWPMGGCQIKLTNFNLSDIDVFLRRGDHIRRNLKVGSFNATYHDGIYLGNGHVAHYTTDNTTTFFQSKGGSGPGFVTLNEFLKGEDTLTLILYKCPDRHHKEVAQRAEQLVTNKVWDKQYNFAFKNCQNFASLCTIKSNHHMFTSETLSKAIVKVLPYSAAACFALALTPVSLPAAIVVAAPVTAFTVMNRLRKSAQKQSENMFAP